MHVVVTGSTKGIGLSFAKEFLGFSDHVLISSRSPKNIESASSKLSQYSNKLISKECDVQNYDSVEDLAKYAIEEWGSIDIWINNAGINSSFKPLLGMDEQEIRDIVFTNSIGTLYGCKVAASVMKKQKSGHIFNMEGRGSNGKVSPNLATYGMTKNSIPFLTKTLQKELENDNVGLHSLSPGMVLTDLIIPHADHSNAKIFNILCETPETVAKYLVPRIRKIKGTGKSIKFLTKKKVFWRFAMARKRRNRFFDDEGNLLY